MEQNYVVDIQGHRGFGSLAPHNSLLGFKKARLCGYVDSVEFDVRRTKDGVLVISHGPELDIGHNEIENLMFEDIRKVDIGEGEVTPTFKEVLEICRSPMMMEDGVNSGTYDEHQTIQTR